MTRLLVCVPEGVELPANAATADVQLAPLAGAVPLLAAGGFDGAVLLSDGLEGEALAQLSAAVRQAGKPVIEVQSQRWDGFTHSPLTGACKGVIAGFGVLGVGAALGVLRRL